MKNNLKRTIILIVISFFFLAVIGYNHCWHKKYDIGQVTESIMNEIDCSVDYNGECTVDLRKCTDFNWDRVVIVSADFFAAGYSSDLIEEMWGFEYEVPSDFRSRLIFLKNNTIVYEESYMASVEYSTRFNISIYPMPYYRILAYDEAMVLAERCQHKSGEYSYSLKFVG